MDIASVREQFPQYSDMSDEQLARALHGKFYADMPYEAFAAKIGLKKEEPPKPVSMTDAALRQLGLGARYATEGLSTIVAPFANAAGAAYNALATGNGPAMIGPAATTSFNLPRAGTDLTGAVSNVLDRVGVPKPESDAEQLASAVTRVVPNAVAWSNIAARAPQAVLEASKPLAALAQRPIANLLASITGAGASEATKQAGGGPIAQTIAGAVAPVALDVGTLGVRAAGSAAKELVRPITPGGSEQIAADVLGKIASDKQAAVDALLAAKPRVPGVELPAGTASGDYGLIGAEQVLARGDAAPDFARRFAQNNAARIEALNKLNATQKVIDAYVARRDAITGPLREQAFANAKGPVDFTPVAEKVGEIAVSAAGGRAESQKAIKWIAERLVKYEKESRTDPANAYALYQDMGDLIAGKVRDENGAALRLAGGLANEIKKTLGQAIEAAAPGFKDYLAHYSRLSKPIDRLTTIAERLGNEQGNLSAVTNAGQVAGEMGPQSVLSQAKMRTAAEDLRGAKLTPGQQAQIDAVSGDLNAAQVGLGGKPPGSDTFQNMATANLLNRALGETLAQKTPGLSSAVEKGLGYVYKPLGVEKRIQQQIIDAFLEREKMLRMLQMARTARISPTLAGETPWITGGLLGTIAR